jgi:hypothetical protein
MLGSQFGRRKRRTAREKKHGGARRHDRHGQKGDRKRSIHADGRRERIFLDSTCHFEDHAVPFFAATDTGNGKIDQIDTKCKLAISARPNTGTT